MAQTEERKASKNLVIRGASLHNLKSVDVEIPRNRMVVITGLSGSGKSSLAFDTIYAEGQRRYVESLSSYARQFLEKLDKPQVDYIGGISPAIAIEQKVNSTNPRSTVGTTTEIYDYLKLLYARIGRTYSPITGEEVRKHTVTDVVDFIRSMEPGRKLLLLAPVAVPEDRDLHKVLGLYNQQGYARILYNNNVYRLDQTPEDMDRCFDLVVDRIVLATGEDFLNRLGQSVDNAFFEGKGRISIADPDGNILEQFSSSMERDGLSFLEPNVHFFSFNNPYGACPKCEGYGDMIGIDEQLVVPNTALSVFDYAIVPWKGEKMGWYRDQLIKSASKFDFPIHKPWYQLTEEQKRLVWEGNSHFIGIQKFFQQLEEKNYKIQNRVMLSRYRGKTRCDQCNGTRLRREATYVKVGGRSITELIDLPIDQLEEYFVGLELSAYEQKVSERLLNEIRSRIRFILKVGLGYLTLNRKSSSLSGGESQRINLATSLGSSLVGSMYILDEPSIGLHPRDTENLIEVLKSLRDLGNTVIVVEHDEDIMRKADQIIDLGPMAGRHGGRLVAQGAPESLESEESLTAAYLKGDLNIPLPGQYRSPKYFIELKGGRQHNLKDINVRLPLECLTVITGISGSGKSTLVRSILFPAIFRKLNDYGEKPGEHSELTGALDRISSIEFVDQNPIGRSSRSNPVTYIKAFDDIRALFAAQKLSQLRNYSAKHFSFNVDGGRCEKCKGEGTITVEMQFMADIELSCDSCHGKRFRKEILEVTFEGKTISDVLDLTVDEAVDFFEEHDQPKLSRKLLPLKNVGLGYVSLGQASTTLSGGEAQRIKLASFLGKGSRSEKTLFIFDEPTTGLHIHDIKTLLNAFQDLIRHGHSIWVVEHHLDLIKCADYVLDLGPEGGIRGGYVVACGNPIEVARVEDSYTGQYLKGKLEKS